MQHNSLNFLRNESALTLGPMNGACYHPATRTTLMNLVCEQTS